MFTNNPLAALWNGKCTIKQYQDIIDAVTHQTTQSLVDVVTNEPCRLSFTTESTADVNTGAAVVSQIITLFLRPNINIAPGSVIEVTQNGITSKYKRSAVPTVYSNHQEVKLSIYEDKI